jgi:hypothetical protein
MIDANNTKLHEIWSTGQGPTQPQQETKLHQGNNGQGFCDKGPYFQEGSSSRYGIQTRPVKLDFPRFDGEDPETWSCRAMQFFYYYATPDRQRLSIASFYMEGKTLIWFQELKLTGGLSNWDGFLRALTNRFGKGSYDDPMKTLTNLKQVGLLEEYKTQFDTLAIKVHGLPDSHKISMIHPMRK